MLLMSNEIRQGSKLSPYFFDVYVDELIILHSQSKLGCHVGGSSASNFSYADDLAVLVPTARALNVPLVLCNVFGKKNLLEFTPLQSAVLLILPRGYSRPRPPGWQYPCLC